MCLLYSKNMYKKKKIVFKENTRKIFHLLKIIFDFACRTMRKTLQTTNLHKSFQILLA